MSLQRASKCSSEVLPRIAVHAAAVAKFFELLRTLTPAGAACAAQRLGVDAACRASLGPVPRRGGRGRAMVRAASVARWRRASRIA